jgi:alpha-beta hydrolase superfamily lysophospholipase
MIILVLFINKKIGHGQSEGKSGYIQSFEDLIMDSSHFIHYVIDDMECYSYQNKMPKIPLYLCGMGLGGAISYSLANKYFSKISGVILVAPVNILT